MHILSTSSSKSAPCTSVLNIFKWKSSYRYSPVHFLLTTFPDRPAKSRKQRPSFGDHGSHFTQKNTGFRALVFSSLNSHVPDLLHFPTTWLTWRLLDDDAVDMLMVRKLTITIVCNSEVSYLWSLNLMHEYIQMYPHIYIAIYLSTYLILSYLLLSYLLISSLSISIPISISIFISISKSKLLYPRIRKIYVINRERYIIYIKLYIYILIIHFVFFWCEFCNVSNWWPPCFLTIRCYSPKTSKTFAPIPINPASDAYSSFMLPVWRKAVMKPTSVSRFLGGTSSGRWG